MQDTTQVSSPKYASGTLIRKAILEAGQLISTLRELEKRSVTTTRTWDPALKALRDRLSMLLYVGSAFHAAVTTVPTKSTGTPRVTTKRSDESNTDAAKDILKMTASETTWTPSKRLTQETRMDEHLTRGSREGNLVWLHTCLNCGIKEIDGSCTSPCTFCGKTCDGQRVSLPQADGDDRDASELD